MELAAAMAVVGSGIVVGKLLVARVPVFVVAGLRLAFASAVLVPMLLVAERGWPRLSRRELGVLALQAFCGIFLFTALLLGGLTLTSAAAAGIVTATTPAVAAVLSALLLRERLTTVRAGGVALAVLGILALDATRPASAAGARPLVGLLLIFGAVIGEGLFIVCGKVAAARVPPLASAATLSVLGFAMFLPFTLWELSRFDLGRVRPTDWAAIAYWGVVVTALAFVLWARGLAVVPASTAAGFTAVLPVSAVLLSYVALGEPFQWAHLLGGACVIGGVVLLSRGASPAPVVGALP